MRVMVEYVHAYPNADAWLEKSQIQEEDFHTIIESLVDTMIVIGRQERHNPRLAIESAVSAAFSMGFEVGRQFPETPFNEQ